MSDPVLPYAGTSGFSGSDTSRERMERQDADGSLHWRQQAIFGALAARRERGLTVRELRDFHSIGHHGQVSAALTHLHIAGRIVRLKQRRERCEVYCLPQHVAGRELSPYRPNKKIDRAALEKLREDLLLAPQCLTAAEVAHRIAEALGEA